MANKDAQLPLIEQELMNAGLPFATPRGESLADTDMGRPLLAALRIAANPDDSIAHRDLLESLDGVGLKTCLDVARSVVTANLSFLDIFRAPLPSNAFTPASVSAITQVADVRNLALTWAPGDQLAVWDASATKMFGLVFNPLKPSYGKVMSSWQSLRAQLPDTMTLEELRTYLLSDEAEQLRILQLALERAGTTPATTSPPRIRILTMHGAKGLEGKVVFIPGFELGIIPSKHVAAAPGLVQESRRLLYVSITRAQAWCILSFAEKRSKAQAKTLTGKWSFRPPPSPFVTQLGVAAIRRTGGLTGAEATTIVNECAKL